jgi:hypothetical protein
MGSQAILTLSLRISGRFIAIAHNGIATFMSVDSTLICLMTSSELGPFP